MTESQFVDWILATAARFGWRGWHVPMPVRPVGEGRFVPEKRAKGLCDLLLLHPDPRRLILAECKRAGGGDLSAEQAEFLTLARGLARDLDRRAEAVRGAAEARVDGPLPGEWANPLGVYLWEQGRDEDAIEAILRSKVMIPS